MAAWALGSCGGGGGGSSAPADTTPPDTTITSGPADGSVTSATAATFAFASTEAGTFQCNLDGAGWVACTSPHSPAGPLAVGDDGERPESADRSHTFAVRAKDVAGNTDPSPASRGWTVDDTTPTTTISGAPADPSGSTTAIFIFASDEADSTYECDLGGGGFLPCASPHTVAGLADGPHTFLVAASDPAGNTEATPAEHSWTINSLVPDAQIDSGPADGSVTQSTGATFTFSSPNDPTATFLCELDDAGFAACTSPHALTALPDGLRLFAVRATNNANTGAPTSRSWTVDTAAPDTTVESGPPDPDNIDTPTFSFGSDENPATYECNLDSGGWTACPNPHTTAPLADGPHSLDVRATDVAGNTDASAATHAWELDTLVPDTTIDSGPAEGSATAEDTPTFTFSSPDLLATFECLLDLGAWAACATPHTTAALPDGDHSWQVRATDGLNADPTPASRTFTVDTQAPDTLLTQPVPPDPDNDPTPTFTFVASETGATFACDLDAAGYAPCASPHTTAPLLDGPHTFVVRAVDGAGNSDPTPASHSWAVDLTAPETVVDRGPASPTAASDADFTFSSPDPLATFECNLDAGGWGPCASPHHEAGPFAEGPHSLLVRAKDTLGNTDPSPAEHPWTVDLGPPETTLESVPDDPTSATDATFEFGSDEAGSTFQCDLDSVGWSSCATPLYEAGPLVDGAHIFLVRAIDAAGNPDPTPASHGWTVDTAAPDTSLDSAPPDPDNDATSTFTFSSPDPTAAFECDVDGGGYSACASPHTTAALAQGARAFGVRAVDPAGNTDPTPSTHTWTLDTTVPETAIDSGPDDPTGATDATFAFSSPDPAATFECNLDGAGWGACASPVVEPGPFAEGGHLFQARALDPAGNVDQSPAGHSWTIDLTAPDTLITSAPPDPDNSTSATFVFQMNDGAGAPFFECRLDGGSFATCTSPHTETGLSEATHTFEVRATDASGNTDPSPASRTWTVDTGFVFAPFFEGFESGGYGAAPWVQGGNLPWVTQQPSRFNGAWAAESGAITHNQTSTLEIRVFLNDPGYVRFAFLASTEGAGPPTKYDYLNFSVDGVEQDYWDFEWPWQFASYSLAAGMHTLKWKYLKDPGVSTGEDLGRLDDVEVDEGSPPPLGPDLVFTKFLTPASAFWGDAIEVETTLKNQGALGAGASSSDYRLSADTACELADTLLSGVQSHGALGPGVTEDSTTSLAMPGAGADGLYWLCARADRTDAVAEDSEANNWRLATGPIQVAATGNWLLETLETGNRGQWPASTLDAAGYLHVVSQDLKNHDLRYGLGKAGKPWALESAAGGGLMGEWVGSNGDLALAPDGTVVAVHYDDGNRTTVWAERSAGSWLTGVLDPTADTGGWVSVHKASDGNVYAAYFDYTSGDLLVAKRNGTGLWVLEVAASAGCVGYYPEIVDDGTDLVVFFHSLTAGTLVAAHRPLAGGAWALDTVDAGADTGYEIGAAYGSDGLFHISYHDKANGALRHAYGNIGSWAAETVDTGAVGRHTAIAEGPGGVWHISYQDIGAASLMHASGGVGSWALETVDGAANTGLWTDIAVEADGTLHIVYHDLGAKSLRHAWRR